MRQVGDRFPGWSRVRSAWFCLRISTDSTAGRACFEATPGSGGAGAAGPHCAWQPDALAANSHPRTTLAKRLFLMLLPLIASLIFRVFIFLLSAAALRVFPFGSVAGRPPL